MEHRKGDEYRKLETEAIYECLLSLSLPYEEELHEYATIIEKSIYNHTIDKCKKRGYPTFWSSEDFCQQYNSIAYKIKVNIDVNSLALCNQKKKVRYYLADILAAHIEWDHKHKHLPPNEAAALKKEALGSFDPSKIASYSSEQLNPLINRKYRKVIELRSQQKTETRNSTILKCRRCLERKIVVHIAQTRSLDEEATGIAECKSCGFSWRL